ncbi:hypothetical protein H6G83_22615 [Anabaena azotica FACHB-119]|uniref:Transposase n=1 Tax=Anabaena azotica FACHB-119 TaxID=947527 RepID=A0ABR8DAK2_9NOST|nr:hypothetical protein [Anabaena azotica FACHB-119]
MYHLAIALQYARTVKTVKQIFGTVKKKSSSGFSAVIFEWKELVQDTIQCLR